MIFRIISIDLEKMPGLPLDSEIEIIKKKINICYEQLHDRRYVPIHHFIENKKIIYQRRLSALIRQKRSIQNSLDQVD